MKTNKIKPYFGIVSHTSFGIHISKEGIKGNVSFNEAFPYNKYRLQKIYSHGGVKVDISNMPNGGSVCYKIGDWFIQTLFTRYIDMVIMRALLISTRDQPKVTDLGKRRINDDLKFIETKLEEFKKVPIICSNIVTGGYRIRGDIVDVYSCDPISFLIPEVGRLELRDIPTAPTTYVVSDDSGIGATQIIEEQLRSLRAQHAPSRYYCFSVDVANSQFTVPADTLEFLVSNRHLLLTCSDVVCNLLLQSFEYEQEDLSKRGLYISEVLRACSNRWPMRPDRISVKEFILNTDDLFEAMGYSKPGFAINDIQQHEVISSSSAFRGLSSLSTLALCVIAGSADSITRSEAGAMRITFGDEFITVRTLNINYKADFANIKSVILGLTAVLFGYAKINDLNGLYRVNTAYLVARLSRSLQVVND